MGTPARNSAGSRSGTLKRVAFKDEQTVHDDGASSVRLIPSTSDLSDGDQPATPVPPLPPGMNLGIPGSLPSPMQILSYYRHNQQAVIKQAKSLTKTTTNAQRLRRQRT